MLEIAPFRGYRYDTAIAGEMGRLIAPPYDVIDGVLRDTLYRLSEYNIARITKADKDADPAHPYASAGKKWAEWRRAGIIKAESQPAFYVYEQYFDLHGQKFSRTALIGVIKLQKPGEGVLPHEHTLAGPRADRLELERATDTQLGQVFGLYHDPDMRVDGVMEQVKRKHPLFSASDRADLLHRLWLITEPDKIRFIQDALREKEILIADGHHRYETSLAYRDEHPENPAAQWRMMAMVNMSNAGLVILPTHRLVKNVENFNAEDLLTQARKHFDVKQYPGGGPAVLAAVTNAIRELREQDRHAFGLYLGGATFYALVLRNTRAMEDDISHSSAWRHLDVAILQKLLMEGILGITQEKLQAGGFVEYIQDFPHNVADAVDRVSKKQCQALFILNPTRAEEVQSVAKNHERMPQKSTFFYPKVYSGLVFNCVKE